MFYIPLKYISFIWRRRHYRWSAAKFRPMFGAQGLWAGREFYRAISAATQGLGFSGLMRRTARVSCLSTTHKGVCRIILTRMFAGPHSSPLATHRGVWRIYPHPDPHCSSHSDRGKDWQFGVVDGCMHKLNILNLKFWNINQEAQGPPWPSGLDINLIPRGLSPPARVGSNPLGPMWLCESGRSMVSP
jgi:hypothetical protein